ncbi:XRE family transcriptional regulator [Paraburkholderia sediminicola]|uniref:XRE family transcriptional regulator n=1 Tax=Paraburkholderia sediminicola TaxID=458836 RepID=UPI0038B6CC29
MTVKDTYLAIRRECFQPGIYWAVPTGAEIQEILRQAGLTDRAAAAFLGLKDKSGRHIRRWTSQENEIPYSAWALLCHAAGHGLIWEVDASEMRTTLPPVDSSDAGGEVN